MKILLFIKHDVTSYIYLPGRIDYILHFASPASPIDYLKYPIQTLKVGSLGTHKALGLAKEKKARVPYCVNFRSIRRSGYSSPDRRLLGKCKSNWSARCL